MFNKMLNRKVISDYQAKCSGYSVEYYGHNKPKPLVETYSFVDRLGRGSVCIMSSKNEFNKIEVIPSKGSYKWKLLKVIPSQKSPGELFCAIYVRWYGLSEYLKLLYDDIRHQATECWQWILDWIFKKRSKDQPFARKFDTCGSCKFFQEERFRKAPMRTGRNTEPYAMSMGREYRGKPAPIHGMDMDGFCSYEIERKNKSMLTEGCRNYSWMPFKGYETRGWFKVWSLFWYFVFKHLRWWLGGMISLWWYWEQINEKWPFK